MRAMVRRVPRSRPLGDQDSRETVRDRSGRRLRALRLAGLVLGTLVLFAGYLRMARTNPGNSDGAANAIQAWEMLHGNLLLRGWTVTDVSFYTTELPQYMLIELIAGYQADVIHIAAAMTYTLLVVLAAAVARGRATGREAWIRAAVAAAVLVVPMPGVGYSVVLLIPDHTGTAVPLLVTWLVLQHFPDRRFLPFAVAITLTWAQLGDPLALFIGAAPVAAVSGWRMLRDRSFFGADAALLVAAVTSVGLTQAALLAIWHAGGFSLHPPIAHFSPLMELDTNVVATARTLAVNFGAYLPGHTGAFGAISGAVHLVMLLLVLVSIGIAIGRLLTRRRGQPGDRVNDILVTAIAVNLAAFILSTQPGDLGTARQIVAVLPFGAALAGRVYGPLLSAGRLPAGVRSASIGTLALLAVLFTQQAVTARATPIEAHDVSAWLLERNLTRGIGGYWASHSVTLATGGRVQVAPTFGGDRIRGYRWESNVDWYDPARNDARFLVLDLRKPYYANEQAALAQYGEPIERAEFDNFVVYVYDRNLLVGMEAWCEPTIAPSMAQCPPLPPRPPGFANR